MDHFPVTIRATDMVLSHDEYMMVTVDNDTRVPVQIWDTTSGTLLHEFNNLLNNNLYYMNSAQDTIVFSPDDTILGVGYRMSNVSLINTLTGELLHTFTYNDPIRKIHFIHEYTKIIIKLGCSIIIEDISEFLPAKDEFVKGALN